MCDIEETVSNTKLKPWQYTLFLLTSIGHWLTTGVHLKPEKTLHPFQVT